MHPAPDVIIIIENEVVIHFSHEINQDKEFKHGMPSRYNKNNIYAQTLHSYTCTRILPLFLRTWNYIIVPARYIV